MATDTRRIGTSDNSTVTNLPYSTQWIEQEDIDAIVDALRSGWLTQGPTIERFEAELAERLGASHAVVVSSGTAALHLACLALGLKPGQRLMTSPLTFLASANCALYCGASPTFADVDPRTGNVTPDTVGRALGEGGADLLIPVHFGGRPADVEGLARVAGKVPIVEDACHAIGAEVYSSSGWSKVGACLHSLATVFSFHPVKPITTGEGGAVLTQDRALARKLRELRSHGVVRNANRQREAGGWFYEMQDLGYNYRLTDIQAALGRAQLRRLDEGVARRRWLASRYIERLKDFDFLHLPEKEKDVRSAWHLFPIRIHHAQVSRREVYDAMRAQGIGVQVHYIPVHLHPYYRERFGFTEGQFPEAEAFYKEELSLPLFATMEETDID
ncbi:MAG: UDP-4-amino-4,6-dideoxy-N-acetyl-beta-L-altrosamine transaminase, partial [Vicinamibacteria bacterium]